MQLINFPRNNKIFLYLFRDVAVPIGELVKLILQSDGPAKKVYRPNDIWQKWHSVLFSFPSNRHHDLVFCFQKFSVLWSCYDHFVRKILCCYRQVKINFNSRKNKMSPFFFRLIAQFWSILFFYLENPIRISDLNYIKFDGFC